jgi:hypothetical protein
MVESSSTIATVITTAVRNPIRPGRSVEGSDEETTNDERPDDCDCSPLFEDLPCWPCYRDGFKKPNPTPEVSDE